jgi:hypothetical protein
VTPPVPETSPTSATRPRASRIETPGHVYDLVVCGVIGAVGAWFFVNALALPPGRRMVDTPTVPLIASGLLMALCLLQGAISIATRRALAPLVVERPIHVAIAGLMMLLFPALIDRLGYLPVALIWLPLFGWIAGSRSALSLAAVTLAVLGLAYGVFQMILGTPLP